VISGGDSRLLFLGKGRKEGSVGDGARRSRRDFESGREKGRRLERRARKKRTRGADGQRPVRGWEKNRTDAEGVLGMRKQKCGVMHETAFFRGSGRKGRGPVLLGRESNSCEARSYLAEEQNERGSEAQAGGERSASAAARDSQSRMEKRNASLLSRGARQRTEDGGGKTEEE